MTGSGDEVSPEGRNHRTVQGDPGVDPHLRREHHLLQGFVGVRIDFLLCHLQEGVDLPLGLLLIDSSLEVGGKPSEAQGGDPSTNVDRHFGR